jgi:hypothetical protein
MNIETSLLGLTGECRCFGGSCCLHLQSQPLDECFSGTLVSTYKVWVEMSLWFNYEPHWCMRSWDIAPPHLPSALHGSEWSLTYPSHCSPGRRAPSAHWIWGAGNTRTAWILCRKPSLASAGNLTLVVQLVVLSLYWRTARHRSPRDDNLDVINYSFIHLCNYS